MAKKLASKTSRLLLDETEIRKKELNKDDFSSTWQGRIFVIDPEKSEIAKKLNIKERGEYAIKVRWKN